MLKPISAILLLVLASCATVRSTCEKVHTTAEAYAEVLRELEERGIDPSDDSKLVEGLKAVKKGLSEAHEVCYEH